MKRILITTLLLVTLLAMAGAASASDKEKFEARLTGAQEVPAVTTTARGKATFEVRPDMSAIQYKLRVRNGTDLLAVAGAHIHCAPYGSNGPVVAFLAGAVPGGLDGKLTVKATLTQDNIINQACGATLAELVQSMRDGDTYVNVHSAANPGGEVRGQIMAK